MSEITPRQARFVAEYLIDLNATRAAVRAGYSAKTAEQQGPRLLGNVGVLEAIQAAMAKRGKRLDITADRILAEIARAAFYDAAEFGCETLPPMRGPADIKHLPEDIRRAIVGWSWDKAGNFTLKLADKLTALDKLGRHLKLFTDKVEHSGIIGITITPDDDAL